MSVKAEKEISGHKLQRRGKKNEKLRILTLIVLLVIGAFGVCMVPCLAFTDSETTGPAPITLFENVQEGQGIEYGVVMYQAGTGSKTLSALEFMTTRVMLSNPVLSTKDSARAG